VNIESYASRKARLGTAGARRAVLGVRVDDVILDEAVRAIRVAVETGARCHTCDYLAGRVSRAPGWMRARGLEWVFRLMQQPHRLPRILRVWQFGALATASALTSRIRREGR
jgi:exopolysaccharide biosynthesis WecB/TagA/CpsF family protein